MQNAGCVTQYNVVCACAG